MPLKQFLEIGKIVATHGITGEVRVQPWCDDGSAITSFESLFLDEGGKSKIEILSSRVHKNVVVLKIKDIETIEQAQKMRNNILYVNREDLNLEEGTYFIQDIIGAKVYDIDTQDYYGEIAEVLQPGANDVYRLVSEDGKQRLVPVIEDVVLDVDISGGVVKIRPLKGLFDDED